MTTHVGLVGPLPPPYGGMANQAWQLYHLLQLEDAVQVSFIQTNAPYSNSLIAKIKGLRALFRLFSYVFKIIKLVFKADVIHVLANSGWSWQLFAAPVIWIGYLCKTPVIINYRGGEAKTYFEQSIKWVAPSMNKASAIVVPSKYLQQVFTGFDYKAQVIPNIIDLQRFKVSQEKPEQKQSLDLIITRNLEAIYGIATAIKAVALIVDKIPNLKLSIAGSGPQRAELLQLVEDLKLHKNVFFTGKLKPDEVAMLYGQADIMLNPTTVDNMPNSVLEAMASGVAIVTTNVGGIPFIVENNKTALLVDVDNENQMAEKIMELVNDNALRENLVKNGLAEVQQYAWPVVKEQWIDLYNALGNK